MKQSSFLRCVRAWTERNNGSASEWIKDLAAHPMHALEWSRTGVESVVFADIGGHFRKVVEAQRMSDGEALKYASRMLFEAARFVPASTGLLDAALRQYTSCAWAKIIDYGRMELVQMEE